MPTMLLCCSSKISNRPLKMLVSIRYCNLVQTISHKSNADFLVSEWYVRFWGMSSNVAFSNAVLWNFHGSALILATPPVQIRSSVLRLTESIMAANWSAFTLDTTSHSYVLGHIHNHSAARSRCAIFVWLPTTPTRRQKRGTDFPHILDTSKKYKTILICVKCWMRLNK